MKHILLPTDFSDNAWNALFTALKLFKEVECHFYLLNAHEPSFANLLGDRGKQRLAVIYDSMEAYSNQELDKVLDYLKEHHKNSKHVFEKISRTDHLVSAIKELVFKKDIEMIIMGTQGATGAKEIFLGSNTVKVIKAIRNRSIIAVPENHDLQRLDHIIFPTDFTKYYESFELHSFLDLATLWKAKVSVLQVGQQFQMNDNQVTNRKRLVNKLGEVKHKFHEEEYKGSVAEAIGKYAETSDANMIVLIHYKHTFMDKLTREPVVKKVAFHTQIPLMVLPELTE